jgi:hypothetical protein
MKMPIYHSTVRDRVVDTHIAVLSPFPIVPETCGATSRALENSMWCKFRFDRLPGDGAEWNSPAENWMDPVSRNVPTLAAEVVGVGAAG